MANSAIRIPIPGSIIDAAGAQAGDLLYFNSIAGQGGAFVNFKPLIQDLRPFTKNSALEFYVSTKSAAETSVWNDAVAKGMILAAGLNGSALPIENDIRLGINLNVGRPSHTLEVVGNTRIWGKGSECGDLLGRMKFYTNTGSVSQPTFDNLIFSSPLKSHSDSELNAVQSILRSGRLLVKHPITKDSYFARLSDILIPGNGISITGNTVSVGDFQEINAPNGLTIRLDSDRVGGESEVFKLVESVALSGGAATDFSLVRIVRAHQEVVTWTNNSFQIGNAASQTWPAVKMSVGAGARMTPSGFVVEDGAPVSGESSQEGYESGTSGGSKYARLFGPVAANPVDIMITGPAGQTNQAFYYDNGLNASAKIPTSGGRFGFLPGFGSMIEFDGFANPGSFVAGFLNKHIDGGGVKVKTGDVNGDEFALFLENSEVSYDTGITGGSDGDLECRHIVIAPNTNLSGVNDQYRNILAQHAPVFTVRATSGDTFVRGFLVMPFVPGINSNVDGIPSGRGATNGETILTTEVSAQGVVTLNKYEWDSSAIGGSGAWLRRATYTLPKGTVYTDTQGNLKVARHGDHIANHGLNGVSRWATSD